MQFLSKDLSKYFTLTFLVTWIFWIVPVLNSNGIINISISNDLFRIIGTFGPSVIGVIFLIKMEQQKGKEIFKSLVTFKGSFNWLFYMFLLMPCLMFIAYLIARYGFNSNYKLEILGNPAIIPLIFAYIFFAGGPLGEELGWRGYALNKLLEIHNPFISSLILGVIWSLWHIPLFLVKGTAQDGLNFFSYLISTTILSILMTVLHIKTKRSIFAALIFHTTSNLAIGLFPIFTDFAGQISIFIVQILATTTILILNKDIMFKNPDIKIYNKEV